MQYFEANKDRLVCLLCEHKCRLKEGQTGLCGVNKNTGGKVECLVYGRISAFNIDPIEKKPLYHFLPTSKSLSLGTVGCNFKCSFCQNWGISQEKNIDTSKYTSPKEVVQIAIRHNCKSISYTYNEPTIFYPFAKDIALEAKKFGIKSVYVSNGFESSEVASDMVGVIDAINVDLKCFDEKYYKKLGGRLDILLRNLKFFVENGIWVEITTLVVPSKNDSYEELEKIANFIANELNINVPWHLSAFHPDYKEMDLPRTSLKTLEMARDIGKKAGLRYVYIGNMGYKNDSVCECGESVITRRYFNVERNILDNGKCPKCSRALEGEFMSSRELAVCGTFYPNNKDEVMRYINHYSNILDNAEVNISDIKPRAIISPHAGYQYSGFSANSVYKLVANRIKPKKIVVIGPSHRVYLEGASVACYDEYKTPLGSIPIDLALSKVIKDNFSFVDFNHEAHKEHSTETQMPFVKHYFPNASVIEIVYGKVNFESISTLINALIKDEEIFFIISTDLSHFYDLQKAKTLDNLCLNAIAKLDNSIYDRGCEACGGVGVKAMIKSAKELGMRSEIVDYRTSFDATNDDTRVVGYGSAIVGY